MSRPAVVPSASRRAGSGWPARTIVVMPVRGSRTASRQVAKRPVSSSVRKTEPRAITVVGGCPSAAYARSAMRSWPMMAAAVTSWPCTSPMRAPTRPSESSSASYQSPPMPPRARVGR